MAKQQPSRGVQLADAVRSGGVTAGAALALLFPAAFLIRAEVLPENAAGIAALTAACVSAVLTEALLFGKRRNGYIYIPCSALVAGMILVLFGACLPMNGWNIGCVLQTMCGMTVGMSAVYFITMNKNNKKSQKKRRSYNR